MDPTNMSNRKLLNEDLISLWQKEESGFFFFHIESSMKPFVMILGTLGSHQGLLVVHAVFLLTAITLLHP